MYNLLVNKRLIFWCILLTVFVGFFSSVHVTEAAALDSLLGSLTTNTIPTDINGGAGGLLDKLFNLLFERILGPILNIFGGNSAPKSSGTNDNPVKVTPLPPSNTDKLQDSGILRGKVIVIDPGHGGSNPGAVANNTRESDNNLAVGLKLRDRLVQAGAKVIMTRDSDRTVAAEGSSLGQELQARVDIAEANRADIFVSIHSNSNPDPSIVGAMTFYNSNKSSRLALEVQSGLVNATGAVDKGTSTATFYVLRNTSMPAILVEMGFVSNPQEAKMLQSDAYRNKIAQGIFNGIVKYFNVNK